MSNEPVKIEVELEKLNKTGLAELCGKVDIAAHSKKAVMVNRLRYAISEGKLVSAFEEPEFDPELEALNQPKPPREKKVKEPKAPKPEIAHNWTESQYAGRQVYTPAGTGVVTQQDDENGYFLVTIDGEDKAVKQTSTRFKAVNEEYRDKYIREETIRTESGAPSIHSGHNTSYAMLGTTMSEVHSIARENGLEEAYQSYVNRPKPLNPGMIRMNIGNRLIALSRKGQAVTIFGLADLDLAAQRGKERGVKEAQAAAERKKAAQSERSEAAQAKKAAKEQAKAEKAEKAKLAAEEKASAKAEAKEETAEPKAKKTRRTKSGVEAA